MKKKKSLITKRIYFAIAVLTLLVAAGIMTTAFTLPAPGSPTHQTLFTDLIASMSGSNGQVTIDSGVIVNKNITAQGGGTGNRGILGSNTEGVYGRSVTGSEGRLGYGAWGVYTPNALYAGSISTGTLSLSGAMSASSYSTTGTAAIGVSASNTNGITAQLASNTGYGVYTPNGAYAGYYSGGAFYGSSISTGPISATSVQAGTISASDTVDANKGFSKSGLVGTSGSVTFFDTSGKKVTMTITGGIITGLSFS